jgi:hypothetical protein
MSTAHSLQPPPPFFFNYKAMFLLLFQQLKRMSIYFSFGVTIFSIFGGFASILPLFLSFHFCSSDLVLLLSRGSVYFSPFSAGRVFRWVAPGLAKFLDLLPQPPGTFFAEFCGFLVVDEGV